MQVHIFLLKFSLKLATSRIKLRLNAMKGVGQMNDEGILSMYIARNEQAISHTEEKYGKQLFTMAMRILSDEEDSRECVNDAYFKAWNSIPPAQPTHLSAYLHKIVRTLSIDRLRKKSADKRRVSEYSASLDELQDCIVGCESPQCTLEASLLIESIERYLLRLPKQHRQMFLCRYHYLDPIKIIAKNFHVSESKVKSTLFRIRCGLKQHLEKEEFFI